MINENEAYELAKLLELKRRQAGIGPSANEGVSWAHAICDAIENLDFRPDKLQCVLLGVMNIGRELDRLRAENLRLSAELHAKR